MGQGVHKHDRVLAVIQENAASLLKLARLHSLCADDAQDAYQRALEIYLRKVDDVDEATAGNWLRTVVKHEAMSVRAQRQRYVGGEVVDPDEWISLAEDGEERAIAFEQMTLAAEALQGCKHDEVSAMVLKAEGHSYKEICSITGWSYTKVNRCLAEGRARFLARFAAIESGAECDRLAPVLSAIADGEAGEDELEAARPHLRNCAGCRATLRALQESQPAIHAVLPVGLVLGGANDGVGLLTRLWELAMGSAQHASLKAQAAVEASSVTKVAAVAASAAAVAGGGVVAMERPAERAVAEVRAEREPATASGAAPGRTVADAAAHPAVTAQPARRTEPTERRARRGSSPEFGFEGAGDNPQPVAPATARAAAVRSRPTPAPTPSQGRASSDSFGFER